MTKSQLDAQYGARNVDVLQRMMIRFGRTDGSADAIAEFQQHLQDGLTEDGLLSVDTKALHAVLQVTEDGCRVQYSLNYTDSSGTAVELDRRLLTKSRYR